MKIEEVVILVVYLAIYWVIVAPPYKGRLAQGIRDFLPYFGVVLLFVAFWILDGTKHMSEVIKANAELIGVAGIMWPLFLLKSRFYKGGNKNANQKVVETRCNGIRCKRTTWM